eukprot:TRINITY_DN63839_c0_g1_i1.p1 TRINITY_DN63839_c0_g1~~TRINITY_DN63839_c0_g1_i1.p1  ORF type:complete len:404 (+),score=88.92 TRINITY_DN63839_c0_g1_i1:63-1274(+)
MWERLDNQLNVLTGSEDASLQLTELGSDFPYGADKRRSCTHLPIVRGKIEHHTTCDDMSPTSNFFDSHFSDKRCYEFTEFREDGRCVSRRSTHAQLLERTRLTHQELHSVMFARSLSTTPSRSLRRSSRSCCAEGDDQARAVDLVRKSSASSILLFLQNMRAVIDVNGALIFGDTWAREDISAVYLEQRRRCLRRQPPFAQVFVESALLLMGNAFEASIKDVYMATRPILDAPLDLRELNMETVRRQRNLLLNYKDLVTTVSASLDSCLSSQPLGDAGDEVVSWDALFGRFMHCYSDLADTSSKLLVELEDFEESASLAMQARRLSMEDFELVLVMASVSIATGAVVPGALGMNLINFNEQNPVSFKWACIITAGTIALVFSLLTMLKKRSGVLGMWTKVKPM